MLTLLIDRSELPLSLLCLGAHSDDLEIGAGGTILTLLRDHPSSTVDWVVFSADPERGPEARSGAAFFLEEAACARVDIHEFRESYFPYIAADIKDAFEEIRTHVDPDLVFTHRGADLHQDHRLISELTRNTFRNHLILEYEIPKYDGDLHSPNTFVPLARETADRKIAGIMKHFRSQADRDWFDEETFRAVLRLRGMECHAPSGYAEGFDARKLVLGPGPSR